MPNTSICYSFNISFEEKVNIQQIFTLAMHIILIKKLIDISLRNAYSYVWNLRLDCQVFKN